MDIDFKKLVVLDGEDEEFILQYLPCDDEEPDWWAGLGNTGPVVLGEMGKAEYNGYGNTAEEAIQNLIHVKGLREVSP